MPAVPDHTLSQLYLRSRDKHLLHHLIVELNLLPDWTLLASQRVGDADGPRATEDEMTDLELETCVSSLSLPFLAQADALFQAEESSRSRLLLHAARGATAERAHHWEEHYAKLLR